MCFLLVFPISLDDSSPLTQYIPTWRRFFHIPFVAIPSEPLPSPASQLARLFYSTRLSHFPLVAPISPLVDGSPFWPSPSLHSPNPLVSRSIRVGLSSPRPLPSFQPSLPPFSTVSFEYIGLLGLRYYPSLFFWFAIVPSSSFCLSSRLLLDRPLFFWLRVRSAGLEPACPKATEFEPAVSTSSTRSASFRFSRSIQLLSNFFRTSLGPMGPMGFEPMAIRLKAECSSTELWSRFSFLLSTRLSPFPVRCVRYDRSTA